MEGSKRGNQRPHRSRSPRLTHLNAGGWRTPESYFEDKGISKQEITRLTCLNAGQLMDEIIDSAKIVGGKDAEFYDTKASFRDTPEGTSAYKHLQQKLMRLDGESDHEDRRLRALRRYMLDTKVNSWAF